MKKFILLLLMFGPFITDAQYRELHFEHLNVVEGLPESFITALQQDKPGYVWIGTLSGLVRFDGYKVKVYKLGSGIKGHMEDFAVLDINETKAGELWIATRSNWVFHYNRATDNFEQYKIGKQINMTATPKIAVDDDGYIWLSPRSTEGLSDFEGMPARRLNIKTGKEEKLPGTITSLVNSKSGRVWIGTEKGLVYYDHAAGKMSKAFFPLTGNGKQNIVNLYEAPSQPGILWFNVVDKSFKSSVLYSFDTSTLQYKQYTPNPLLPGGIASAVVYIIREDDRHRLWFGTSAGLSLFDRAGGTFKNYTPPAPLNGSKENPITNIAAQADGKLWLGSFWNFNANGLLLFDPSDGTFKRYLHDEKKPYALNLSRVVELMVDRAGSVWAGLAWGGLDRINGLRSGFDNYFPGGAGNDGYPGGGAFGSTLSTDGYCWLGSREGLIRWKPNTDVFERISLPTGIQKGTIHVYTADADGLIWCDSGSFNLFTYDPKSGKVDTLAGPGKWSSGFVNRVYQDRAGLIWIGTEGKGLYSYDKHTLKFTAYPYETSPKGVRYNGNKLDDGDVLSIYEDRQGVLWVGTNYGGVNRFNKKDGTFTSYFDMSTGLGSVEQLYEDKAGRFWVGTYLSGLYLFDRKTGESKRFTQKTGLLDDDIEGIREDPDGNLWITCQRGFTRLNPVSNTYSYFTAANALPFNLGKTGFDSFLKTNDQQFIVFSRNGALSFYPGKLGRNAYPPEVAIESIAHNDPQSNDAQVTTEYLYGRQRVELPHNQNRISFDYVALHYENPAQNRYAYQLTGFDKNWVMAGAQRNVTYTNLSPGTYTFKVKASNSDGVWNNNGASVIIVIAPPWWATWWAWVLWIALFISAVYGFVAYRSRKLLYDKKVLEGKVQARTEEVMQQKEEIEAQRDSLEQAFDELKTTQKQLIQSEKMASLGELTAGIAHEIQNPLNFVNNFSEVSVELTQELKEELKTGNTEDAIAIADDLEQNLGKIQHHGKRADAIVKSMLQHSQSGSGKKELVALNALIDECMRLAYHGLRAKDKSFNAELITHLDESLPKVNVIQQDMVRVMLNLFNNAFYAVNQKFKISGEDYKPTIEVTTFASPLGGWGIKIKDNGVGIPNAIKDKIMQPFFTTKPTGEGTGLGLSLTYDMVVKGHGGNITVDTKEGEFTIFTINLPSA